MEWISVKDNLPILSYEESDDEDHAYRSYPVLLYLPKDDGKICVGYLVKDQDEESWSYGDLSWEGCVPTDTSGSFFDISFDKATHWMSLPEKPED